MWKERKRVIYWWISFACFLHFVFTTQTEFRECCVWFQWFTQWHYSSLSNKGVCWCQGLKKEKNELFMDVFCVSSLFRLHRSNRVSWVLCLISTLHSMMLLLFLQYCCLLMWRERKRVICRWMPFVSSVFLPIRSSSVSVVFDFNASLNNVIPL